MGLRAMFSGISGLQAHSTWLDVIGNNISNVNTVAYKSSRVEFADQVSQGLSSGSGPSSGSNLGGVDPEQVGLGTRVASIQTLFTQGPTLQTGITTDIALQGTGFLQVKSGTTSLLTRAGNLTFDGSGNLVDQNGGLIQGFTASTKFTTTTIESAGGAGNVNALVVTQGALTLDNTNTSAIGNININQKLVLPAKATTVMNFTGNLDSFQQVNTSGGILDVGGNGEVPILPVAVAGVAFDNTRLNLQAIPAAATGQEFTTQNPPATVAGGLISSASIDATQPTKFNPLVTGAVGLSTVTAAANNNYAWDQSPALPPAATSVETVYDSLGNPRQITTLFYQVNDIGGAGVNAAGASQVAYAWYSFDTTSGKTTTTPNLLGGTGIIEGEAAGPGTVGYDRGIAGNQYWGDFIYFNTDGSLASTGGAGGVGGGISHETVAHVYLPADNTAAPASPIPTVGAEIVDVSMNFGTAGILGKGLRDGIISDAEGSFKTVSGVSTYVANNTASVKSQDGYADGTLQNLQFDSTGTIVGTFTNGQNVDLAQLSLVSVDNPDGLSKVGTDYFQAGVNSGSTTLGLAGKNGFGTIQGGALEGSNVDLTVELSNMIIAQRGFEVNARVIAVTNQNLQTLTQLGQGG